MAEGFVEAEKTAIPQHLREETGIKQMENGVLDSSHVLVHRQPAIGFLAAERQHRVVGITETEVVPG